MRLFLALYFAFIAFTIIGTLSHEAGHFVVAKLHGYPSHIGYNYTFWDNQQELLVIDSFEKKYRDELILNKQFPEKAQYEVLLKQQLNASFLITFGGPLQTMLTGSIAFGLLVRKRNRSRDINKLKFTHWLLVFFALFWLRQPFNFIYWIGGYFRNGEFSTNGDEIYLANYLNIPEGGILIFTALIGFALLFYTVFRIIPVAERWVFVLAGLTGGITGFLFWIIWAGPLILP
jgi:hypothetical protein